MNWTASNESLAGADGLRFSLSLDGRAASVREVIDAWQRDEVLPTYFSTLLAGAPYKAFRWETPAVSLATMSRPFECVVLDSPGLDRQPDAATFAEQFRDTDAVVAAFANLSGDAIMVVPRQLAETSAYGHLAAFVRLAPNSQRHALWRQVGTAMAERINAKPVWLNTAGAGVAWLHVRLDDRPKYYHHEPYRRPA